MRASTPGPATTPRLKKKQSWIGSVIRSVVAQGALTAKAAVDAVRERIDGPTSLPTAEIPQPQEPPPEQITPKPRHRKTQSVRSTISSVRARLSRRSFDHRHHSIADLRVDSRGSNRDIPECIHISPKRRGLAMLAAQVPLPSSPIDVPVKAPSLSIDLGPRQLMLAHPVAYGDIIASPRRVLHTTLPPLLGASGERIETNPISDQQQLACLSAETSNGSRHEKETWPFVDSPLPGTNSGLELEDASTPTRGEAHGNAVLVIGDLSQPEPKALSTQMTFLQKLENLSTAQELEDHSTPSSSRKTIKLPLQAVQVANSGPPSPERPVRLVLRPKPSIDSVLCNTAARRVDSHHDSPQHLDRSLPSLKGSSKSPRSRRPRKHNQTQSIPDMTAAILQERTDDHLLHPERLADLTNAKLQGIDVSPISHCSKVPSLQQSSSCPRLTGARKLEQLDIGKLRRTPTSQINTTAPCPANNEDVSPMCQLDRSSPAGELLVDSFTHQLRMASSSPSPVRNWLESSYNRLAYTHEVDGSDSDVSLLWTPATHEYGY